jgi:hypothetical protein
MCLQLTYSRRCHVNTNLANDSEAMKFGIKGNNSTKQYFVEENI